MADPGKVNNSSPLTGAGRRELPREERGLDIRSASGKVLSLFFCDSNRKPQMEGVAELPSSFSLQHES